MDIEPYDGREQSAAKHLILGSYLEVLAFKVGQFRKDLTFNYVDGFSGPWESKTGDLSDTSPSLALQRLVAVRQQLAAVAVTSTRREREDELARLQRIARERGYKPGWIGVRFKEKYGFWPRRTA